MGLKEHLEAYVSSVTRIGHHALLERFLLRNGKTYEATPLVGPPGEIKMCFWNSYLGAKAKRGVYTEGLAMRPGLGIPIHHAWLTVDGKAMDLTWNDSDKFGTALETEYLGVEFDFPTVRRISNETGFYGSVLGGEMYNIAVMRSIDAELVASVMRQPPPKIEE